jgi:hypothetical protein
MAGIQTIDIVLYASAGFAMAIALFRMLFVFRSNINIEMFNAQVVKLVMGHNLERTLRLCAAAPNALFVRMVRPALSAALDAKDKTPTARAARAEQAFAVAYDNVLSASDRLGPLLSIAAMGFAVFPLIGAAVLRGMPPVPLTGICVSSGLMALWSYQVSRKLRAEAKPAFARVAAAMRKLKH